MDKPQLMLVELNEFEPGYLAAMATRLNLKNLQRVLAFQHTTTFTSDLIEHQGLDPWVQWVSVHSGKPTTEHGIRRLGNTQVQTSAQIWNAVAQKGYTWGAWGVMNAPQGDTQGACFFMPDPWSFDEKAYPAYLNDLLALPRYTAQNYLEIDYKKAFAAALRLLRFFLSPSHWKILANFTLHLSKGIFTAGSNVHTLATLLDYLSVLCFVKLRCQFRPDFSVIFLNHIAHLQHQFWTPSPNPHPEIKLGLQLCDAMLGLLLADRRNDEAFILLNALKQKNVAGQGFYVYRQSNPQKSIEALAIMGGRVEQCMTHDATILFSNPKDAENAVNILEKCQLSDGHKAFYVERQTSTRIFYQLAFEHKVEKNTQLLCGDSYSKPFYEIFQLVCERTGAHVPQGDVFSDGITIPDNLANHEVFNQVLNYFGKETPKNRHNPVTTAETVSVVTIK